VGTHTIEVTDISDELLELLDERVREMGSDRASFVRELIRSELQRASPTPTEVPPHAEMTFEKILKPVHEQAAASGLDEEELESLFEETRARVRDERKRSRAEG
jgi:hypothetical protein